MEIRHGGKEYFNKKYIRDHPYYLFIYEDTLDEEDYEDYFSNVFPIPTFNDEGYYFKDKNLENNKELIRDGIEDIEKAVSKGIFKKVIIPELPIGKGKSNLYKEELKTYEYIKKKIKELLTNIESSESSENKYNLYGKTRNKYNLYGKTRNKYNLYGKTRNKYNLYGKTRNKYNLYGKTRNKYNLYGKTRNKYNLYGKTRNKYNLYGKTRKNKTRYNDNNDNRRILRKIKKKELKRKKEKKDKKKKKQIKIDSVEKASKQGKKNCNKCIKLKSLLDKPIESNPKKADKFINELTKAENKCIKCQKICKFIDKNLKKKDKDYDIYEAQYPSICLKDDYGNKRVFRLSKSYRNKLLEQIEKLDLNLEN